MDIILSNKGVRINYKKNTFPDTEIVLEPPKVLQSRNKSPAPESLNSSALHNTR